MTIDPVNPLLKYAAEEIKAVLKKHDIAAFVVLCSGEQSEYVNWMASPHGPSWSALLWEPQGVRLRAKAKRNHAERFKLSSTVKAAHTIREVLIGAFGFYDQVTSMMKENLEIEAGESSHLSHENYLKGEKP